MKLSQALATRLREFRLELIYLFSVSLKTLKRRRAKNWKRALQSQEEIIKIAKEDKSILLKPVSPYGCPGSVDHYYHFMVDFMLPLHLLTKKDPHTRFAVRTQDIGMFATTLELVFSDHVELVDAEKEIPKNSDLFEMKFPGMNPKCVDVNPELIEGLKMDVYSKLNIDTSIQPDRVLMIERLPPDGYFAEKSRHKRSGAQLRSIINHDELFSQVESMLKKPLKISNVRLEKMPFEEQVDVFSKALIIIAQHGAGLLNQIWMRPETIVVELNTVDLNIKGLKRDHFRSMSKLKHQHYFWYKTESNFATVDVPHFKQWLLSHKMLRQYFQP